MTIILVSPQIPQNTGNIIRTCSVTGAHLILVEPLGFSLSDRWLKRAGLDYFEGVNLKVLKSLDALEHYLEERNCPFYFFSSHATTSYTDVPYTKNTHLIFGSETSGLPKSFHIKWEPFFVKIPMLNEKRCLNLATSVGIGMYELIRQCPNYF